MPLLSCAMIVRDSAATLDLALSSVRQHVDELVIVDTGSTDATCEIASRYADVLVGIKWPDHFGAARQHAFDLTTGDWCMFLDADDELEGGAVLRTLLGAAPSEVSAYLLRYVTELDDQGRVAQEFWRERIVRKGEYQWSGRVHEVLIPLTQRPYLRAEDARVVHRGHGGGAASLARNIRLLQLALEDDPEDTRLLFYYGRDLVASGELARGREVLERYLGLATWADEAYIARQFVGHTLRSEGRFAEAYKSDLDLLDIKPLWPQAYFALAEDCYFLGRWPECVHFCEMGERLPMPESNLFVARKYIESGWMVFKAVALHHMGRTADAASLTLRALRLLPDNPHHLANAAYFTRALGGPCEPCREAAAVGG